MELFLEGLKLRVSSVVERESGRASVTNFDF
jgi:hypothetical protein